jgi:hypothetical protein
MKNIKRLNKLICNFCFFLKNSLYYLSLLLDKIDILIRNSYKKGFINTILCLRLFFHIIYIYLNWNIFNMFFLLYNYEFKALFFNFFKLFLAWFIIYVFDIQYSIILWIFFYNFFNYLVKNNFTKSEDKLLNNLFLYVFTFLEETLTSLKKPLENKIHIFYL